MDAPNTTDIFDDDFNSRDELLRRLREDTKVLKSEDVARAFEAVDRRQFVGSDYAIESYEDYPLPIPGGQTISQPTTVVFMLELLDVKEGQSVLDVGSGSGYTTALLAELVGKKGHVLGAEVVPELVHLAQDRLATYPQAQIELAQAGTTSYRGAPFDRILVSAAAAEIPSWLLDELNPGGILVIPIDGSIIKITKPTDERVSEENYPREEYPGFTFVPFQE